MLSFSRFKMEVDSQFDSMKDDDLFMTDVSKDVLWDTYLKSFPAGTKWPWILVYSEKLYIM